MLYETGPLGVVDRLL
jgi:hypothetical protein